MATGSGSPLSVNQQRAGTAVPSVEPNQLGINLKKPKFPQYALLTKRLETFKNWKEYFPVKPDALAEAGLVYTGSGDSCRCYHCGGGIRHWEEGDQPWVEHAKWYPTCAHVLLVKGKKFVDEQNMPDEDNPSELPSEDVHHSEQTDSSLKASEKPEDSVAVQACRECGYNDKHIQEAISIFTKTNGNANFDATALVAIILEIEENGIPSSSAPRTDSNQHTTKPSTDSDSDSDDPEGAERLLQENERMKEKQTCRICMETKASIIFLPCGHLVSCPQCALALTNCPVCRSEIKGSIKAYFASDT